jgi:hypothetical protein
LELGEPGARLRQVVDLVAVIAALVRVDRGGGIVMSLSTNPAVLAWGANSSSERLGTTLGSPEGFILVDSAQMTCGRL